MRPLQRGELAHRRNCEGDTATLWRARMYWQAMRNTAGSRAQGKCSRLGRKASVLTQVITKERDGRRQVPEDGNRRVGRVCKVKLQEHLPTYRLHQFSQGSRSATKQGLFGVSGRELMLPATPAGSKDGKTLDESVSQRSLTVQSQMAFRLA